jgi:hypothetical protein
MRNTRQVPGSIPGGTIFLLVECFFASTDHANDLGALGRDSMLVVVIHGYHC